MIIGITGNSGTGKTEISKILAKKINAEIINADEIAKKMTNEKGKYFEKIVELFGNDILIENKLNRNKIAQIIYEDRTKREQLNNLTNKYVVKVIKNQIKETNKNNIILDVPLLFESKLNEICNLTISVIADKQIKIKRICERDNITNDMAEARLNIQNNDEYYIEKSDYILKNNGKIDEIKLEEICTKIGKN